MKKCTIAAVALVLTLLGGLVLTGCSAGAAPSSSSAASEPVSVSLPASSSAPAPSSVSVPSVSYPPTQPFNGPATTSNAVPALPVGTLVPVTDVTMLEGSWLHFPEGDWTILGEDPGIFIPAYQCRFNPENGWAMVSVGRFGSDGGRFFNGSFALGEDGLITIEVPAARHRPDYPADDYPVEPLTLTLRAEWPQGAEGGKLAVFTLLDCEGSDPIFEAAFKEIMGIPLAYDI